jgi:radical SAM protein with 4Fe4S-binding SPASM domain
MIKQFTENIVYVVGNCCSAIYCFDSGKVFSINNEGTLIMKKYIEGKYDLSENEEKFISKVKTLLEIQKIELKDYTFVEQSERKLIHAWLEVTQKCTSRCIHCYEGKEHLECSSPLSLDEWKNVIDQLSQNGCDSVQFIGGEPTLYTNIEELIEYTRKKGFKYISIFSNLYALNDSLINSIVENRVSVHFSIYGSEKKYHDAITNVYGSFEKLIANVIKLVEKKVELTAHIVIMKENELDRENIYTLLSNLNISNVRYDEIRKVFGGGQNKYLVKDSKIQLNKPNFKANRTKFNESKYRNTCWNGKCVISTNGDVYPCEFERNILYGNIRENSLNNIIQNDIVEKCWYFSFDKVEGCRDCEFRFACQDCRPLAYAENGNLSQKNPRCKYNPYTGNWK